MKQGNKTGGTAEEAYGNIDLGSALKQSKFISLNKNFQFIFCQISVNQAPYK